MDELTELADELAWNLSKGGRLVLFLDYDGTLAEFAPTPEFVQSDPALVTLLTRLTQYPERLRVVILSGRSLEQVEQLLPVAGLLRAGTYGIEMKTREGERVVLLDFATNRPVLDQIKPVWKGLIDDRAGFYLEDKGWSLALHARLASPRDAEQVLTQAEAAVQKLPGQETFHLMAGRRFLEIAPLIANKGQGAALILDRLGWGDAKIVYIGDDDQDEQAFSLIRQRGGIAILAAGAPDKVGQATQAAYFLSGPGAVRAWVERLSNQMEKLLA